jgi:hypothetical protein
MTYSEAIALRTQNLNILGKPFRRSAVKHLIISTPERLTDIIKEMFKYDHNNESALAKLGILNSQELDVFVLPDMSSGLVIYGRLLEYLEGNGQ